VAGSKKTGKTEEQLTDSNALLQLLVLCVGAGLAVTVI
jgi:hypothetical protein